MWFMPHFDSEKVVEKWSESNYRAQHLTVRKQWRNGVRATLELMEGTLCCKEKSKRLLTPLI